MRKKLATIAMAVAMLGGGAAVASPAQAGYGPSYCNASTCSLWGSPDTSRHITEVPRGAGVTMLCWTDSAWWNGTNRWFKVDTAFGRGYMNANQVANQTRVGRC